jgi:hypothetical protein
MSAPPHTDADIVRHVAEEAGVTRYLESTRLLPIAVEVARVFEQAQKTLRAAQDVFEGRAHAGAAHREARRLLEQQLVSHYPNAYQCGGCGFGPVDHDGCGSLISHQGQISGAGVIINACPGCGWFSRNIDAWPRWEGRLLPEREVAVDMAGTYGWVIKDWSKIRTPKRRSEPFTIGGFNWRLLIFPKGNSCKLLSVYLDVADPEVGLYNCYTQEDPQRVNATCLQHVNLSSQFLVSQNLLSQVDPKRESVWRPDPCADKVISWFFKPLLYTVSTCTATSRRSRTSACGAPTSR